MPITENVLTLCTPPGTAGTVKGALGSGGFDGDTTEGGVGQGASARMGIVGSAIEDVGGNSGAARLTRERALGK